MMGGMLAGHDQSGGEVIEKNGRKVSLTVVGSVVEPEPESEPWEP
jgi:hypothetical protein